MKAYYANKIITVNSILTNMYLLVEDNKIKGLTSKVKKGVSVIDYGEKIIAPGYIDVHSHGGLGYASGYGNFEELKEWIRFKLSHGVTGFLLTTPSIPLKKIKRAVSDVRKSLKEQYTNILGLQLEGPFYSISSKIGAQNPKHLKENISFKMENFINHNKDIIKYLSLDPKLNEAERIISICKNSNIKVAAGHSTILHKDFVDKNFLVDAITHTFNGMKGLHHRQPGLAYTSCMDKNIFSEIICDGLHISYPMLELFFKLKGYTKTILITDSMSATGLSSGSDYKLGDIKVKVNQDGSVRKNDGGLAGSTLTMDRAVQNLVDKLSISPETAINMASLNPAKLLGIDSEQGSLAENKLANFIVLNNNLEVEATYIKGKEMFNIEKKRVK